MYINLNIKLIYLKQEKGTKMNSLLGIKPAVNCSVFFILSAISAVIIIYIYYYQKYVCVYFSSNNCILGLKLVNITS